MKLSIKLDTREKGKTDKGYPIVVSYSENYKKKLWRLGFFSFKKDWNQALEAPKKSHPDFYTILDSIDIIKNRIGSIQRDSFTTAFAENEVYEILFKKSHLTFYDSAMDYIGINSRSTAWSAVRCFDKYFPAVPLDGVNDAMVRKFISVLLKSGKKPAGVDSYIRSLRAVWNKITTLPNPFAKKPVEIPDKINTVATVLDLQALERADLEYTGTFGGYAQYRDYFLLMFYLGGIDPEVLAKLRYDVHVVDSRIVFNRDKGRSKVACNNLIPGLAWNILKKYDCRPYLVPINQAGTYKTFMGNFNRRLKLLSKKIGLSKEVRPKTPRYTFINRAQELLIDERITGQIVGHRRKTTTSLYTNAFPLVVQDDAHLKVISV